jgi:small basic protein
MMRPHPFLLGQVIGALAVGLFTGVFLNIPTIVVFCLSLAGGAAVSALICRWRPGFDAAGWKLWLVGTFANPVMLAALAFTASEYECLLGRRTGWDCILSGIGPFIAGLCCLPPIVGLLARWWARRRA